MNEEKNTNPIGILNKKNFLKYCSLTRFYACETLQPYIEHYWYITWQLPKGVIHKQSVIPHPSTHLVFLDKNSHIQGVCKQKYTHELAGEGSLIGVKFTPAGFYIFAQHADIAMRALCNTVIDIADVFTINAADIEKRIFELDLPTDKITLIDSILLSVIGKKTRVDINLLLVNSIVAEIESNSTLITVDKVAQHFALSVRQLQRLFEKYIGINVKWVINRYRIHEALTTIEDSHIDAFEFNWAELALQLGYYDQAHFIHDFSQLVGQSPKNYQHSIL